MEPSINLKPEEITAKNCVLNILLNGLDSSVSYDEDFNEKNFKLPDFYDKKKFERGQKYLAENRYGIFQSNICGLFSLICEPNGAKLLDETNNSSTASSARKRYVSTILHVLSWCTDELAHGSRSWESIKKVRRMHLTASNASIKRGGLGIPQMFMSFTTFGFMGFAIAKPELLGIKYDCKEDREAYVHMWAVITSLLGIRDEFNICFQKLEVVESICHILIRYFFNPLLQMETRTFQKLGHALCDGLKFYILFLSYDCCLFLTRRLAGIPGYQLDNIKPKGFYLKQYYTKSELEKIDAKFQRIKGFEYWKNLVFCDKMQIITVERNAKSKLSKNFTGKNQVLNDLLMLEYPVCPEIIELTNENYEKFFNSCPFETLPKYDKLILKLIIFSFKPRKNYITNYIFELLINASKNIIIHKLLHIFNLI